jgi:OOP family OmpA-OmpF porin
MKKIILLFLFAFLSVPLWAQNVQWSFKILEYSSQSQKDSKGGYSAIQALGMPNVSPQGKENIHAWEPKGTLTEEYIKVGFLNPIKPKQIVIVESFHPGYITKILAYDAEGKEHEISNYTAQPLTVANRFFHVNTPSIDFYVFAVKVILKCDKNVPVNIDAIGISESDKQYKMKSNPNDLIKAGMIVKRLDTTVNSKFTELGPLVSPDGKTLYFSRRGDPTDKGGKSDKEDIWYSQWDESKKGWGEAKNIGKPLNNDEPNFINSISPDGNTIVVGNSYYPDGTMEDGVSISRRTNNGWSFPKRLIIEDDEENISKKANYFLSNSQKILLISNDRKKDSYGDRDLYVSFPKADSTWTKPLNLGKVINTKGEEAAPFLASDDKTLYFTSDGLSGYGGSDIYMSRRLDDSWTKWSEPENLGPVVNTSHNESFFTLTASGDKVYFTSQTKDGDDIDMYMLILPPILKPLPVLLVSGRVLNSKTNEPIPDVKIFFENLSTGAEMGVANSSPGSGTYQIVLPSGSNYGYLAQKDGFISVNSNIDLTNMPEYREYKRDLYLTPIEEGQSIVINNIFFDFDKYELKKESFLELDRLVTLLKKSATMKIEISANTDNIGTEEYNDKLSIKRAEAVFNYLVAKTGVDKSRIVMKHYGELMPVASNATAKGRQLNRRVEFKILAK